MIDISETFIDIIYAMSNHECARNHTKSPRSSGNSDTCPNLHNPRHNPNTILKIKARL